MRRRTLGVISRPQPQPSGPALFRNHGCFRVPSGQAVRARFAAPSGADPALHQFQQGLGNVRGGWSHGNARVLKGRDLGRRRAFAAADDGARVAHPAPRRRGRARMDPATGFRQFCLIQAAASSSEVPPISPIMIIPCVSGSSLNIFTTSRCEVPLTGSPPMPTHVDWPTPRWVSCQTAS